MENIGAKIRLLRKKNRLTLKEFSLRTKLTPGALSQIERGIIRPSVGSLKRIADELRANVGFFFGPQMANSTPVVVRRGKEKTIRSSGGVTLQLLSPSSKAKLEVIKNYLAPGGTTSAEPYSHFGEEFGIVLKGKIKISVGGRSYILKKGDTIWFDSSLPHRFSNAGSGQAVALWINHPLF